MLNSGKFSFLYNFPINFLVFGETKWMQNKMHEKSKSEPRQ